MTTVKIENKSQITGALAPKIAICQLSSNFVVDQIIFPPEPILQPDLLTLLPKPPSPASMQAILNKTDAEMYSLIEEYLKIQNNIYG